MLPKKNIHTDSTTIKAFVSTDTVKIMNDTTLEIIPTAGMSRSSEEELIEKYFIVQNATKAPASPARAPAQVPAQTPVRPSAPARSSAPAARRGRPARSSVPAARRGRPPRASAAASGNQGNCSPEEPQNYEELDQISFLRLFGLCVPEQHPPLRRSKRLRRSTENKNYIYDHDIPS